MFDAYGRFIIEKYQKKPAFSSFLPGIAGKTGIPLWCYYNNRGQAVCSFGVDNKDHAIMEFSPAHVAYREVSYKGFRTFARVNGRYRELFGKESDMYIGLSDLEIESSSERLKASVSYFGIPEERVAALGRILTVENTGKEALSLELLDGMPEVVPYGVDQDALKNMTQLAKAWMQVEDSDSGKAWFGVRASMEDTASVTKIEGGNFGLAWEETGRRLLPVVESRRIFGEDTSYAAAERFAEEGLDAVCAGSQQVKNSFPCCFFPVKVTLAPGEKTRIYSLYGQADRKKERDALIDRIRDTAWFLEKRQAGRLLTEALCEKIGGKTADPVFDAYCKQSYLDNLLRGGVPVFFTNGENKVPFYLYSRKHGDPEREYNYFSLGREYYAQGNGNFRDVNQNRRSDVLFDPEVGAENIYTFFDLIQTDGYNPLVLNASTFTLPKEKQEDFARRYPEGKALFQKAFTPGRLAMAAEDWGMTAGEAEAFTAEVICASEHEPNATFQEGYWSDHWTYNLDLIESYLSVFPEKKHALLFEERRYRYFEAGVQVNPRAERYCMTERGLRQYSALKKREDKSPYQWMHTADQKEARSTLMEKLLLLCTLKTATLDAAGMGVEMEGGKPGWYDALNGLPGLLGSSMAESCELERLLRFTIEALEEDLDQKEAYAGGADTARAKKSASDPIELYEEPAALLADIAAILQRETDAWKRWDAMNEKKEQYRLHTVSGYSGARRALYKKDVIEALKIMETAVAEGVRRSAGDGIIPTYYMFEAEEIEKGIPQKLIPTALPLFLEGPVHYLKLPLALSEKYGLAEQIRQSGLYDEKLKMYKVNESIEGVSYEAGRAKVFTPGWLENESIWLHMEYKYLLELLKSGMYDIFGEAFRHAAVPFMDQARYGRSLLENVSFLASSANPDPAVHGRGFVARLSGSTAELLQIWQILFFGQRPFTLKNGTLSLCFAPCVPEYLLPKDGELEAVFLGHIPVTYHAAGLKQLIPGAYEITEYDCTYTDGSKENIKGACLPERTALLVREGQVKAIGVTLQKRSNRA